MKITGVKTFIVDGIFRPWTFVKIETDSGIVGWGDCTEWQAAYSVAGRPIVSCGIDFRNRIRELLRARAHPATRPNPHTTRCRHQRHRLDETPRITSRADWKDVNLETGVGGRRLVRSTAHLLCDSVPHVSGTMEGHRSTH